MQIDKNTPLISLMSHLNTAVIIGKHQTQKNVGSRFKTNQDKKEKIIMRGKEKNWIEIKTKTMIFWLSLDYLSLIAELILVSEEETRGLKKFWRKPVPFK